MCYDDHALSQKKPVSGLTTISKACGNPPAFLQSIFRQSLQRATTHDCVSLSSHIGVLSKYPLRILFLRHTVPSRKKVQLCSTNEQITGQTYIAANWDSKACPICQGKEGQDIRLIDRDSAQAPGLQRLWCESITPCHVLWICNKGALCVGEQWRAQQREWCFPREQLDSIFHFYLSIEAGRTWSLPGCTLPTRSPHSLPALKQPMKRRDAHPRARLPVGPCQAASHVFHRQLEASVHLLCAADTKRNGSQTVHPDRQKRCLEQVAGAAAGKDRRTDNQTDRQQDQQTPSITSSLRRGEACSARDGPPGTGSRLTRFCLPQAGRLKVFFFFG